MRDFILRTLVTGGVIFGIAFLLPDLIEVTGVRAAVAAALLLALVNALIRPVVLVLTLPLNFMTLGLFTLVVNASMLYITAYWVDGFTPAGFRQAMAAAVLISVVGSFLAKRVTDQAPEWRLW